MFRGAGFLLGMVLRRLVLERLDLPRREERWRIDERPLSESESLIVCAYVMFFVCHSWIVKEHVLQKKKEGDDSPPVFVFLMKVRAHAKVDFFIFFLLLPWNDG